MTTITKQTFQRCFNVAFVVLTLPFGSYDVAAWDNVKSTLKQRCVFQGCNLQCRTTSNHFLKSNLYNKACNQLK